MNTQQEFDKASRAAKTRTRVRQTVTYFLLSVWGLVVLFGLGADRTVSVLLDDPDFGEELQFV